MQMCPTRPEVLYCSDVTCRHCDMLLLMAQQSVTTSREYPPIHVLYFFIDLSTASLSPPLSCFLFVNYSTMSQQWPIPCQHCAVLASLKLWWCEVCLSSFASSLSVSLSPLPVICVCDSRLTAERQHMFVCAHVCVCVGRITHNRSPACCRVTVRSLEETGRGFFNPALRRSQLRLVTLVNSNFKKINSKV